MKNQDNDVVNKFMKRGTMNAGLGVGAALGGRKHNAAHMAMGAVGGAALGHGVGHLLGKTKLSHMTKMGIGAAGHAIGLAGAMSNFHRQMGHMGAQLAAQTSSRHTIHWGRS